MINEYPFYEGGGVLIPINSNITRLLLGCIFAVWFHVKNMQVRG